MNSKTTIRAVLFSLIVVPLGVLAAPGNNVVSINKLDLNTSFSFDTNATEPLIEYHNHVHMLAGLETQPLLRIYGDGRVLVHFPQYMKKSGDYEMQISQQELIFLLETFVANDLMEFDEANVNAKQSAFENEKRQNGQLFHISDDVTTQITINLKAYQSANISQTNFKKQIRLKNIDHGVKRYSSITEVQKMGNSIEVLRAYLRHTKLRSR